MSSISFFRHFVLKTILVISYIFVASAALNVNTNTSSVSAAACGSEPTTSTGRSSQSITVPTTGTYTIWSRLKAPDANPVEYKIYVNGQCFTIGQTALTPGTLTWGDFENGSTLDKATVSLTAGTHTLVATAGSQNLELDRIILLTDGCTPTGNGDNCQNDTTLPTTSVTSPSAGATLTGTVLLTANATDNDAIDRVEFYRAGTTLLGTDNAAPFSYSWDTTTVTDGAHSLTARAYDISGNVQTSTAVAVTVNNAPIVNANITSFTSTPSTVTVGQSSLLQWSVSAGTGCLINQGVGNVGLTGSQSVTPTATTTYTLSCNGQNGGTSATATTTITVNPAPVNASISSFTATPSTITTGPSSNLAWGVSAGTGCTIDQGIGAVGTSGNQTVSPTITTTYTLSCNGLNGGTSTSATATITFNNAPVNASISSFTATPSTITVGQSSSLGWSVAAGQNCTVDQGIGVVAASGAQTVSPTNTITYTMTCDGLNGGTSATATATITVNPAPVNANITSFSATPATITTGQSSSLSWAVSAGTGCIIDQSVGPVSTSGMQTVSPASTLIYTLTCNGLNGGSSGTATVTIAVSVPVVDTDGDSIVDGIEQAGSNGGDSNYDGTQDSQQPHVISFMNVKTGAYNTLVSGGTDCKTLGSLVSAATTASVQGILSFNAVCTGPGGVAQMKLYLDKQYNTSTWKVMKFSTNLSKSIDITTRVSIKNEVLGTTTKTVLEYTLTDGGDIDEDTLSNGTIVDPIGIVEGTSTELSNTGESRFTTVLMATMLVTLSIFGIVFYITYGVIRNTQWKGMR